MTTPKRKSRILDEMHQTATGLHRAGLISKRRMGEFDALCRLEVHEMAPKKIKSLREDSHLSQAVFAAVLNTSLSTVRMLPYANPMVIHLGDIQPEDVTWNKTSVQVCGQTPVILHQVNRHPRLMLHLKRMRLTRV